jgi:antitoxin MazE
MYLHCRYSLEAIVDTRVQKWGNSLALRIPKSLADEAGLGENSPVRLVLRDGELLIQQKPDNPPTLDELLSKVTKENMHREIMTGPATGGEIW